MWLGGVNRGTKRLTEGGLLEARTVRGGQSPQGCSAFPHPLSRSPDLHQGAWLDTSLLQAAAHNSTAESNAWQRVFCSHTQPLSGPGSASKDNDMELQDKPALTASLAI